MDILRHTGFARLLIGLLAGPAMVSSGASLDYGPTELRIRRTGDHLELVWPGTLLSADGSVRRPWFEVQINDRLDHAPWQTLGQRLRATTSSPDEWLRFDLSPEATQRFYRLVVILPETAPLLGDGGEEVFGYGEAFDRELRRIGQISTAQFEAMHPSGASYLSGLSWDPTTGQFWDQFDADPEVVNRGKKYGDPGYRQTDFRLDSREKEVFRRHGFVVSERLGGRLIAKGMGDTPSFGWHFEELWHNDLPVFVSTDAILHAWHRTYQMMLEDLEETFLYEATRQVLDGMARQLPAAWAEAGGGVLRESIRDADYLLVVARSVLADAEMPYQLEKDSRLGDTLAAIRGEQLAVIPDFFGSCRTIDFSQFKVRGHYDHSERLRRYFRCLTWLGRIDLAIAGGPFQRCEGIPPQMASPRELGTAIVLHHLLRQSGEFDTWIQMNLILETFVGWSDSLNFPQLGGLLAAAGIDSLADVPDLATLERLQQAIVDGDLGLQDIPGDAFVTPLGPEPARLPRAFLVLGQRFAPDSWAFAQTVFDRIQWTEGTGEPEKVQRRVPSALDVAFGVLGNNQVVPELVARIGNPAAAQSTVHLERWRDGLPYQHNLAAVRAVIDAQSPEAWNSNLYVSWLAALRELSPPTTGPEYPEVMRTRAWAMKTVNTQLASWTQLRHDTILYVKQSYTSIPICSYPDGYVEPRVAFWQRLADNASLAADRIASLSIPGEYRLVVTNRDPAGQWGWTIDVVRSNFVSLASIRDYQAAHLREFAATVRLLERLSRMELAGQCFGEEEKRFIQSLVEENGWLPWGCGYLIRNSGWYPRLFYRPLRYSTLAPAVSDADLADFNKTLGALASDVIVADVHTDLPAPAIGDPGSVLHEAIGHVNLLVIAIDHGPDRAVYAGPVLSHYEIEQPGTTRLSDGEWELFLARNLGRVGLPPWSVDYVVPWRP